MESHYIESLLPFENVKRVKQIPKTKDFYKPEGFIWSNAHRTSKRLYPYYHKFNDQYMKTIQPQIEKMIEEDRVIEEKNRIRRLA